MLLCWACGWLGWNCGCWAGSCWESCCWLCSSVSDWLAEGCWARGCWGKRWILRRLATPPDSLLCIRFEHFLQIYSMTQPKMNRSRRCSKDVRVIISDSKIRANCTPFLRLPCCCYQRFLVSYNSRNRMHLFPKCNPLLRCLRFLDDVQIELSLELVNWQIPLSSLAKLATP